MISVTLSALRSPGSPPAAMCPRPGTTCVRTQRQPAREPFSRRIFGGWEAQAGLEEAGFRAGVGLVGGLGWAEGWSVVLGRKGDGLYMKRWGGRGGGV